MKNFEILLSTSLPQSFKISTLALVDYSSGSFHASENSHSSGTNFQVKKFKRSFKNSPYIPFILVGIIVAVIVIMVLRTSVNKQSVTPTLANTTANKQVTIAKPLAQETINKNFDFPLKDVNGKIVSKIHYEIQSAELDNQIVVKGQIATAVQGRVFLILNLKITNNYVKAVQLNTRDYVRLVVDNATDRLAADVHNDPVDVEAIATKYTRLGFPIDTNAKNLKLEVGEISGPKQTIQLNLK